MTGFSSSSTGEYRVDSKESSMRGWVYFHYCLWGSVDRHYKVESVCTTQARFKETGQFKGKYIFELKVTLCLVLSKPIPWFKKQKTIKKNKTATSQKGK